MLLSLKCGYLINTIEYNSFICNPRHLAQNICIRTIIKLVNAMLFCGQIFEQQSKVLLEVNHFDFIGAFLCGI